MTLNMGASLNFLNFQPFQLKYVLLLCNNSENNVLSYSVITLQVAHVYLEDCISSIISRLHKKLEYFQAHITFTLSIATAVHPMAKTKL